MYPDRASKGFIGSFTPWYPVFSSVEGGGVGGVIASAVSLVAVSNRGTFVNGATSSCDAGNHIMVRGGMEMSFAGLRRSYMFVHAHGGLASGVKERSTDS